MSAEQGRFQAVDRLGTIASTTCAVHCGVSALAPALLTMLGLGALMSHSVEWGFAIAASGFALVAAIGAVRQRRAWAVAGVLIASAALIIAARFLEAGGGHGHDEEHEQGQEHGHGHEDHAWEGMTLTLVAGVGLVTGHIVNLRASRAKKAAEKKDSAAQGADDVVTE